MMLVRTIKDQQRISKTKIRVGCIRWRVKHIYLKSGMRKRKDKTVGQNTGDIFDFLYEKF